MTRVIFLNAKAPDFSYLENPELERRILTFRRHMAEQHTESILEDRLRRVRAAQWARRKAAVINWASLMGEMLMLASAFLVITGLIWAAGQLGYHSSQGEWMP